MAFSNVTIGNTRAVSDTRAGSLDPDESHIDDSWLIATAVSERSELIAQAASRQMFDELALTKLVLNKPVHAEAWSGELDKIDVCASYVCVRNRVFLHGHR